MIKSQILAATLYTILLSSCAHAQSPAPALEKNKAAEHSATHIQKSHGHNEPRPYLSSADAMSDVDAGLIGARLSGKNALIIMGANWCHDSRSFAAKMQSPPFADISDAYEVIYVSAGEKSGDKSLNPEVAKRFGVDKVVGTPTIFITKADGTVLNEQSAKFWRTAASVPSDIIHAYLTAYAAK